MRTPSPDFAETYGCSVQDLVPPRQPLDPAVFDGLSDAEILKHYLAMVRTWRETERPQCFRADDLQTLVGILGTDVTLIEGKIRALTGCSRKTAKWFRRLFVLGLAAPPALFSIRAAPLRPGTAPVSPTPPRLRRRRRSNHGFVFSCSVPRPERYFRPQSHQHFRPGAVVKVSVAVMAYVGVQLDSAGTPVAVRTNTGNAPDCQASWYVFGPQHTSGDALENMAAINQVMDSVAGTATLPAAQGQWLPGTWYRSRGRVRRPAPLRRYFEALKAAPDACRWTCSVETSPRPLLPVRWAFQHRACPSGTGCGTMAGGPQWPPWTGRDSSRFQCTKGR